jgi:tetratricopeptide (TPR) repeat protein
MLWQDIELSPQIPLDVHLRLQRESVARRPHDAARYASLGEILLRLSKYGDAAAAFEQAKALSPRNFHHFDRLAKCYDLLDRPDAVLEVCDRGAEVMPYCSDLQFLRGTALRALGQHTEARAALLRALALSHYAFEAAECLMLPLASDPDGARLLALCESFPSNYANSTVVRGYRAIALSRVGRLKEARSLVDLERCPARITFEPPAEFGGIERFNELLANEILRNPGLRLSTYGFYRTEQLAISGAPVFPVLAKFLRRAIEDYIAEFVQRGLDVILPPPPSEGFLFTAGNVIRAEEGHRAHLHKFGYISGVYHVSAPPDVVWGNARSGALVLGPCDGLTDGYVPCWGRRDINPVPGVATLFPSHIFHSVVPTQTEQPRIAISFDLSVAHEAGKSSPAETS